MFVFCLEEKVRYLPHTTITVRLSCFLTLKIR